MAIFTSMVKKESIHLLRDSRTLLVVLFMPIVLLLLFGFAISTEVNNIRVVAVVDRHTDQTREILERFRTNPYFSFEGLIPFDDVVPILRRGDADAAVVLKYSGNRLKHQVVVDASNTTIAQTSTSYIESVISGSASSPILVNTLYNPQLKSAYNFVPGIMGMIFILICAMMTSVSIVSEKESGTMDLLLVSPVKPITIILGKIVPYFFLSCVILSLMMLLSYTVLGLPVSSSLVNVIWVTLIYVVLALSIGILISTIANSQITALLISAVLFMLPVIMLSGMLFPIDNMPVVLQWISCIIPARWYIDAMRTLMIQQLPIGYVMDDVVILTVMMAAVMSLALIKFNKKN